MATPSFKIEIDYDNKTCTVTDLNPQGTSATLTVESDGFSGFDETFTIDIASGDDSVTFDMPLENGDIEEASYLFHYENSAFNPTAETEKTITWANPTLPEIEIVKSHNCELLTYHTEDATDYSLTGYTVSFSREIVLTPPSISQIEVTTVNDTSSSPVGEIDVTGEVLVGIFVTSIETTVTYSKTDYSFSTVLSGSVEDDITCSLNGTSVVDAMETLITEWEDALITNYSVAMGKQSILLKVMSEHMLYVEYLQLGNVTKAAIHSDNIKTLLNLDDE